MNEEHKFKRGDKVMIRKDLIVGVPYNANGSGMDDIFTKSMKKYSGKVVNVDASDGGRFIIDEDNGKNVWTENMITDDIQTIIE